jgi:hypothetical protein
MGIGLRVWLADEIDVSSLLDADGWAPTLGGGAERTSSNSLAGASAPSRVFPPDVPAEVSELVPGVAWMVDLSLEGVTAAGERLLNKAATAIARAGHGVVEDPQVGSYRTPRGVRRYEKPKAAEKFTVVSMGWWAPGGPLLTAEGVAALFQSLEHLLPEAVPLRWGMGEPPDHSLAEEGVDALVHFIDEFRDDLFVFKLRRPCLDEMLVIHSEWGLRGGRFNRFETTHFSIEVDASVLEQPGWGRQLSRTFEAVNAVIQPFYAEARQLEKTTDGFGSQRHPIRLSSWKGLPVSAPLAAALGEPYVEFWPDFPGHRSAGVVIASDESWGQGQIVDGWEPPPGLAQEFDSHWAPTSYGGHVTADPTAWPAIWPFLRPDGSQPTMASDQEAERSRLIRALERHRPRPTKNP